MNGKVPQIVQYQGSKRLLAGQILRYMPAKIHRLIEPFAGVAAISVAAAQSGMAECYHINDLNAPLLDMLRAAIEAPEDLFKNYSKVWLEQFNFHDGHIEHYYKIRDDFNNGARTPANMLYLLARCVKGSVRYGRDGNFNQSPDKRRHGTNPANMRKNLYAYSCLLKGKSSFSALDYHSILEMALPGDFIYMDPPYQGVSNVRDNRYLSGVPFDEFAAAINDLNKKDIPYLISYDGACGGREYGRDLPVELGCRKILLNAGLSSQAILLGKKETTFEALYISKNLLPFVDSKVNDPTVQTALWGSAV